jgi:hypothetical protein
MQKAGKRDKSMEGNPNTIGNLTKNFVGMGTVTPEMVQNRAVELALINGRTAQNVSKLDWEQAKRELTGGVEADPKDIFLESLPESDRWNPVAGTEGHQLSGISSEDEDEEGRSNSQRLVEEGVKEAEHDQMKQASRTHRKDE